jgi:hypothetical protein
VSKFGAEEGVSVEHRLDVKAMPAFRRFSIMMQSGGDGYRFTIPQRCGFRHAVRFRAAGKQNRFGEASPALRTS